MNQRTNQFLTSSARVPLLGIAEVAKARKPAITVLADRATAAMFQSAVLWLQSLRKIPTEEIRRVDIQAWLRRRAGGSGLKTEQNSLRDIFIRIMTQGGQVGIRGLRGVPVAKDVASAMTFSMVNEFATAAIDAAMLSLIQSVSLETRSAIALIIRQAFESGGSPAEQARLIRPLIGLTTQQAQAVISYRRALETGRVRDALDRALRDKRYDNRLLSSITNETKLRQAQIDEMVRRYADRQLRHRAMTIARTETIRAANLGLQESWRQAAEQGLLPSSLRKRWIVSTDERTCSICSAIPGMNSGGVAIGANFATPIGSVSGPPVHVACRCALGLR